MESLIDELPTLIITGTEREEGRFCNDRIVRRAECRAKRHLSSASGEDDHVSTLSRPSYALTDLLALLVDDVHFLNEEKASLSHPELLFEACRSLSSCMLSWSSPVSKLSSAESLTYCLKTGRKYDSIVMEEQSR